MDYIGIDIGSTAAKVVVRGAHEAMFTTPTGWSSKETVKEIYERLEQMGIARDEMKMIATGYGRNAVDLCQQTVTEITCHGRGGYELAGEDCTIIDVGGQDTKVIHLQDGLVAEFVMNDKCSAGTGKFVEIMANRLGVTIGELFELAAGGQALPISSLCTVFAESEIINYIGAGRERRDIAAGILDSVAAKVAQLYGRKGDTKKILLTGGLSGNPYFAQFLAEKIGRPVEVHELGIYAGALGGALLAEER